MYWLFTLWKRDVITGFKTNTCKISSACLSDQIPVYLPSEFPTDWTSQNNWFYAIATVKEVKNENSLS